MYWNVEFGVKESRMNWGMRSVKTKMRNKEMEGRRPPTPRLRWTGMAGAEKHDSFFSLYQFLEVPGSR